MPTGRPPRTTLPAPIASKWLERLPAPPIGWRWGSSVAGDLALIYANSFESPVYFDRRGRFCAGGHEDTVPILVRHVLAGLFGCIWGVTPLEAALADHVPFVLGVTGGRDVSPTPVELDALVRYAMKREAVTVRHGGARGVDQAVAAAFVDLPLQAPDGLPPRGPLLPCGLVDWVRLPAAVEWPAAWDSLAKADPRRRSLGQRRNRAMISGMREDSSVVQPRYPVGPGPSWPRRIDMLVAWPGGAGTAGAVEAAERSTPPIPVLPIAEVVREMGSWPAARA